MNNGPSIEHILDIMTRLEISLKARDAKLKTLDRRVQEVAALPIAMLWTDSDLVVREADGLVMKELMGLHGRLIGQRVEDVLGVLLQSDSAAEPLADLEAVLSGESRHWLWVVNGRRLRCFGDPQYDDRGSIIGTRVVAIDETDYLGRPETVDCCWITCENLVIRATDGPVNETMMREHGIDFVGMHVTAAYEELGADDIESMCRPFYDALKGESKIYQVNVGGHRYRSRIRPIVKADGTIVGTRKLSTDCRRERSVVEG